MYIEELEKTVMQYEGIIASHVDVIKDLQDHVYEYLGDAM